MSNTYFTITNSHGKFPIKWSQYNQIAMGKYRLCEDLTNKLFYKARETENPYAYVIKLCEERWFLNTVEMDYNKSHMESWIEQTICGIKPGKKPEKTKKVDSIGDILEGMGV